MKIFWIRIGESERKAMQVVQTGMDLGVTTLQKKKKKCCQRKEYGIWKSATLVQ
jgi:hypothetical protein